MNIAESEPVQDHDGLIAESSLRRDSVARFTATLIRIVGALLVTVITARWLGPAGKGALSTLLFISVLMTYLCSLGLGEAAILLRGQRSATLQEVTSNALGASLLTIPLGIAVLWSIYHVAGWSEIRMAVIVASVGVAVGTWVYSLTDVVNSLGRITLTSAIYAGTAIVILLASVVLVAWLEWDVEGAVLADLLGLIGALVVLSAVLRSSGALPIPRISTGYLRKALPLGIAMEGTHLLTAAAERFDLLLVYWLAGEAEAGIYSVALTLGQMIAYAPAALSYASFPQLATDRAGNEALVARLARMAISIGLLSAAGLAVLTFVFVPVLLGEEFRSAVAPALVLIGGGLVWGLLGLLAKAAAARGDRRTYVMSLLVSVSVMVGADLVAVPAGGALAASVVSSVAPVCGLTICFVAYRRRGWIGSMRELLPTGQELKDLRALPGAIGSKVVAVLRARGDGPKTPQ